MSELHSICWTIKLRYTIKTKNLNSEALAFRRKAEETSDKNENSSVTSLYKKVDEIEDELFRRLNKSNGAREEKEILEEIKEYAKKLFDETSKAYQEKSLQGDKINSRRKEFQNRVAKIIKKFSISSLSDQHKDICNSFKLRDRQINALRSYAIPGQELSESESSQSINGSILFDNTKIGDPVDSSVHPSSLRSSETSKIRCAFTCSLPKRGYRDDECEDRYKHGNSPPQSEVYTVAIADGVGQALFSGKWAEFLVESFVAFSWNSKLDKALFRTYLKQAQEKWKNWIKQQELPWYTQRKLKSDRGSSATFLGIIFRFDKNNSYKWEAVAVGDCCFFLVRNKKLFKSFPLSNSQEFKSTPAQLSTSREIENSRTVIDYGELLSGDSLYFGTDAMAQWILETKENCLEKNHLEETNFWNKIEALTNQDDDSFRQWIIDKKNVNKLVDDDITLLRFDMKKSWL